MKYTKKSKKNKRRSKVRRRKNNKRITIRGGDCKGDILITNDFWPINNGCENNSKKEKFENLYS